MKGKVIILDQNEKLLRESNNLIVNSGKLILANLLAGNFQNNVPSKLGIGTSNIQPKATDTRLFAEIVKVPITFVKVSNNSVIFNSLIDSNTGNNFTIRELGLFTDDNKIFSRALINPLQKDSSFAFIVRWEILF